jgi:dephospho-CoA kinase
MIWIGVTGGIGSGKSLVCSEFARLNIPIFFADDVAKEIADKDDTVRSAIRLEFGDDLYDSDNKLKRKELATRVFGHSERVNSLNSIIHPVVFKRFSGWKDNTERVAPSPYGIVEAALMFESGFHEMMDYILLVEAETQTRIQRVMLRDNVTESSVQHRIESQASPEILHELSDFILQNSGSADAVTGKVQFFHILFKNLKKREEIL